MTTPKVFILDGINKIFPSDVPIKGKEFVAIYTSISGLTDTYNLVPQGDYNIVNDSAVFNVAPVGQFLRLIVGTNRSELLNSPNSIAKVAVNMDAIYFVSQNIDAIVEAYNVIATAENIDKITLIGNNINAITSVNNNLTDINLLAPKATHIGIVGDNIAQLVISSNNVDSINTVADSILNVNKVGSDINNVNSVAINIDKVVAVFNNTSNINVVASDLLEVESEIEKVGNSIINVNKVGDSITNVNLVAENINSIVSMSKFRVKSETTLLLSDKTLPKSPVMVSLPDLRGFEVDIATNSIKNVSGRDLDVTGSMAIQISSTATADIFLYVYSEHSLDGTTWVVNQGSMRKIKVVKEGIDYITVPSLLLNSKWLNGQYNRFKFYKEGTGDLSLVSVNDIVNGTTINGQAFLWTIHEI